ncbi:hypothetical protein SAMN06297144_1573 [Sphingomonas guangdongensis]|uniref:TonB C-terminal domain-containing protein n=1 Tax=Sphingomonas guangdongensis TaxID=1141890 RepID=A0A285QYC1_9SPHN|nr:hypothetical protein [Sphingomonas guangdongensis]SOB86468.1 hypothetical protein SAMN06297144_1573 [Sphingomonas guangdongensis]
MLSVMAALAATAAQAAPAPTTAAGSQARFDAATKAWQEGRCAEAVTLFDALATSDTARRNATVAAAIAVRRGMCLSRLGRADEAEASIRGGIDRLAVTESLRDEAADAYHQLAALAQLRLDYDTGIADANRALALTSGVQRIRPLLMLAALTRFDGDGSAIRSTAEALQLIEMAPKATKQDIATAQVAAARALLAADRIDEANALLKKALSNNGGLTTRSTLADIATRYDLAQVALLKKRPDEARLYLAYTGAGRQSDTPFERADSLKVPDCGEVPGLTPESSAVVEFSLAEDGTVTRAEPVYARGGRAVALAFGRAVLDWSWKPEVAKAIAPFYRAITRVELRCTRSASGGDLSLPLRTASEAWLQQQGVAAPPESERPAELIARWRAAATGSDAAALAANLQIAHSPLAPATEQKAAAERTIALAAALGAPTAVKTDAALAALDQSGPIGSTADLQRSFERRDQSLRALLARPEIAADPVSAATLRLAIARQFPNGEKKQVADADQLLAAVADARGLPERHPLKVHALLAQANAAAARGDLAAAASAFGRTGLTEQQCALIGATPRIESSGASASLYPADLVRMGFEGWTQVEFDIAADGRTAAQRALISYPPFLFGDVASTMVAKTRFARSYRPEATVACAADKRTFIFKLPS